MRSRIEHAFLLASVLSMSAPLAPRAAAQTPAPESLDLAAESAELLDFIRDATGNRQLAVGDLFSSLDLIVATIPDPDNTPLSVSTDETIDAISSSAVRAGYLVDAHYLPWRPRTSTRAPASDAADAGCEIQPKKPEHPSEPLGALLFKRESEAAWSAPQWLAVLLVPESPVLGIAAKPLQRALQLAGCAITDPQRRSLHVMAPMFSGSAQRLWGAINECKRDTKIVSGSATGDLGEEKLLNSQHAYGSTLVPDDVMRDFLYRALVELHGGSPDWDPPGPKPHDDPKLPPQSPAPRVRIALLNENGTGYASTFANTAGDAESSPQLRFWRYQLPLHLAQLRVAQAAQARTGGISTLRHSFSFDLAAADATNNDRAPAFSDLTAPEVDSALRTILQDVSRRAADYIVIVATDPADAYFVAREAKAQAPTAQPIAFGGSLLLAHPEVANELSSMLMVSSYPLTLDQQQQRGERKIFMSEAAEGSFNAVQWLIAHLDVDHGRATKFQPVDYAELGAKQGPRPWLMLVEDGRVWPLRADSIYQPTSNHLDATHDPGRAPCPPPPSMRVGDETDCNAATDRPDDRSHRVSPAGTGISLWVLGGAIVQLWLFSLAWHRKRAPETPYLRAFARPSADDLAASQYQVVAHTAVALWGLFTATIALQVYSWSWLLGRVLTNPMLGLPRLVGAALLTVALPLASGALLRCAALSGLHMLAPDESSAKSWRWNSLAQPESLVIGLLIASAMTCLVQLWFALYETGPKLLLRRLSDPFGPTPLGLLFFLVAAVYLWAICGLARATACERFPKQGPTKDISLTIGPRLLDTRCTQGTAVRVFRHLRQWQIGALTGYSALALWFWSGFRPSFAWPSYDWCARGLMFVVCGAIIASCLQARLFWALLECTLEDQAALAMVDAYSRIASKVSHSFGLQLRSHVPPPSELSLSLQSLDSLIGLACKIQHEESGPIANKIAESKPLLEGALRDLRDSYGQATAADSSPLRQSFPPEKELAIHTRFYAASSLIYTLLQELWQVRATLPGVPEKSERELERWFAPAPLANVPTIVVLANAVPTSCRLWIRAAEDFVAMRVTTHIYHVLNQIRLLLGFALGGALLVLWGTLGSPLQPARWHGIFSSGVLLVAVLTSLRIIVGMQGNELLKRLAPASNGGGKLSMTLIQQVVTYVVLPTAFLLSRLFPQLGDSFARNLEPLFTLLR